MASNSAVSYPTAYTTSGSIKGTRYKNAIGKGADTSAASGNDYCSRSGSYAHIYYSFDFSDIPADATIVSVACQVKGHCESTSAGSRRARCQLYVGTSTAKGSYTDFSSTSAQTLTLDTGTWTRAEVDDLRLRFELGYYGGLINGATITITYEVGSKIYRYHKANGAWALDDEVKATYSKSGSWAEKDPSDLDTTADYTTEE